MLATRHQGDKIYKGSGRQCMGNSIQCLLTAKSSNPCKWTTSTLDDILYKGDQLYQTLIPSNESYLSLEDIPLTISSFMVHVSTPLQGTLVTRRTDPPTYTLEDAIDKMFTPICNKSGYLFTIGSSSPYYTSAIVVDNNQFYFFDPHSRSETGMVVADGQACMTTHQNTRQLCHFIRHLSASLRSNSSINFEIAKLLLTDVHSSTDSTDSDFSGFSSVSDGEVSCKLFLAKEKNDNIDTLEVSDVSSVYLSDISQSSVDLDSSYLDRLLDDLNDSATFIKSLNVDALSPISDENGVRGNDNSSDGDDDCCINGNYDGDSHGSNDQYQNEYDVVCEGDNESNDEFTSILSSKKRKKGKPFSTPKYTKDDVPVYPGSDSDSGDNIPLSKLRRRLYVATKLPDTDENGPCFKLNIGSDNLDTNKKQTGNVEPSCSSVTQDLEPSSDNENIAENKKARSRKRQRNQNGWKRNVTRKRRNEGKSYIDRTGKYRAAKKMKPGCGQNCRYKCKQTFSDEDRETIFHSFWQLGCIERQRYFIHKNSTRKQKTSKTKSASRRHFSISYFLPRSDGGTAKVCKTYFLHTLAVSDKMVRTVHSKSEVAGVAVDDRGKHKYRPNKITDSQKQKVRDHINSFRSVESHYCRKDTTKKYLPSDLSVAKMYNMYKQMCEADGETPVKLSYYREYFNSNFNLAFNKPLKDQCDVCSIFQNSNDQEKDTLKDDYIRHLENKQMARENKTLDKQRARNSNEPNLVVAVFDLEEVLLTPNSFQSCMYYKRRLNTFNFTVYDMGTKDGYCYIWHEAIASRGGCEIASCVFSFISDMSRKGKKEFIFYSDNCTAQNKNRFYVTMLWFCLHKFGLTSITHKYLEKGHTQSEGDSIHAAVETASRKISVYSPQQWSAVVKTSRINQPYIVKEMSLQDFFDFRQMSTNIKNFEINSENEKLYWNSIKVLRITSSCPNQIEYKMDYSGVSHFLDLFHRLRLREIPSPHSLGLPQLRKAMIKIRRLKYLDLVELCRKNIIPSIHHAFYLLLPHE